MISKIVLSLSGLALGLFLTISTGSDARAQDLLIGSGERGGVYHQVARALCRIVNRHGEANCTAFETSGALFNLDNVRGGAIEFGVAPSDLHFHAVNKSGPFEFVDATYENLRSVLSLHGEPLTVIARRDSGIRDLSDLRRRRVNLGSPGSPERALMMMLMASQGWTRASFLLAEELPVDQQSLSLCHGRIEAMVYYGTHPNAALEQTTSLCDATLVNITGAAVDKLVAANPYFSMQRIERGTYSGVYDAADSFGTTVTIVTSADIDDGVVRDFVRAILADLARLSRSHPALKLLDPAVMVRRGLSAPLHDGARRYYSEIGLL